MEKRGRFDDNVICKSLTGVVRESVSSGVLRNKRKILIRLNGEICTKVTNIDVRIVGQWTGLN